MAPQRAGLIQQAIAAIASDILDFWWAGPYSPAKHEVITDVIRRHLVTAFDSSDEPEVLVSVSPRALDAPARERAQNICNGRK